MFGIEIETSINRDKITLRNIGNYSNPKPLSTTPLKSSKFWDTKTDGSLHNVNFENGICLEIVTKTLNFDNTIKAIEEFKKVFSKNGKQELNEVLDFNTSCGCHIHFSLKHLKNKKDKKFSDLVLFSQFKKMRETFFKKIKDSKVLKPQEKEDILKHYFRGYARKSTPNQYYQKYARGREFNTSSEVINRGIEWRSFNLNGVTNWKSYDECFKIMFECVKHISKILNDGYKSNKRTLSIPKKQELLINLENLKKETIEDKPIKQIPISLKKEKLKPMKLNLNFESDMNRSFF